MDIRRKTTKYLRRVGVPAEIWTPVSVLLGVRWDWVHLGRLSLFDLLYKSRMMDDDECEAVDGMSGRRNRSIRRKPAPELLCPSQIPHALIWARTRSSALGSRRRTAWATVRPLVSLNAEVKSLIWGTLVWKRRKKLYTQFGLQLDGRILAGRGCTCYWEMILK
jgi:hypothetical protein